MTIKEYRDYGKNQIEPKKHQYALMFFIYSLILGVLSSVSTSFFDLYNANFDISKIIGDYTVISLSDVWNNVIKYLQANYGIIIFLSISSLIISIVIEVFVNGPMQYGWTNVCYRANQNDIKFDDIFSGFTCGGKNYKRIFKASFLMLVYEFLWGFWNFGIMSVIKSYAYSQVYYIIRDNPQVSASDALKMSERMMKGHKWNLFVLEFSYIGWYLLSLLTLGILMYWIMPRIFMAEFAFYQELKAANFVKHEDNNTAQETLN